jgi:hypothetical protein
MLYSFPGKYASAIRRTHPALLLFFFSVFGLRYFLEPGYIFVYPVHFAENINQLEDILKREIVFVDFRRVVPETGLQEFRERIVVDYRHREVVPPDKQHGELALAEELQQLAIIQRLDNQLYALSISAYQRHAPGVFGKCLLNGYVSH